MVRFKNMRINVVLKAIAIIGGLGLLTGCAALPNIGPSNNENAQQEADTNRLTSDFSRSKLIAADFVSTIAQIPATDPNMTMLHTTRPSTRFGELLLGALQDAGYDLRIGDEGSDYWLDYNASLDNQPSDTGNPVYTFVVAAGEVKLKRSYEVDQYGVWPAGNMFVRGADASSVVMDDSIFSVRKPAPEPQQLEQIPEPATIAAIDQINDQTNNSQTNNSQVNNDQTNDQKITLVAVPTPEPLVKTRTVKTQKMMPKTDLGEVGAETQTSAPQAPVEPVGGVGPLRANTNPLRDSADFGEFANLYETGESRYKELFEQYDVVDSRVLVFPNDSLVMGKLNKNSIQSYASSFNPETDVISVIGCSHGPTDLENGNAYLANGRAFRVKEEFLLSGLDGAQVLEEGCWANVAYPELPSRGVLVQHKRKIN